VLGLSYGGVEDVLGALGMPLAKTTVYANVQAAGMAARQRQGLALRVGRGCLVIGSDGTYVKVKGQEVGVQVVVDDRDRALLGLEIIVSENAEEVLSVVRAVAEQRQYSGDRPRCWSARIWTPTSGGRIRWVWSTKSAVATSSATWMRSPRSCANN
jgi:hypothetical protein